MTQAKPPRPAPSERAFLLSGLGGDTMAAVDRSLWAHRRSRDLDPWREHDACGVGFVARASGEPSPQIARFALQALARVAHRGAAATARPGDGAGLLSQLPRHPAFLPDATRPR